MILLKHALVAHQMATQLEVHFKSPPFSGFLFFLIFLSAHLSKSGFLRYSLLLQKEVAEAKHPTAESYLAYVRDRLVIAFKPLESPKVCSN